MRRRYRMSGLNMPLVCTAVALAALAVGYALGYAVDPQDRTAEQMRQAALVYLGLGIFVYALAAAVAAVVESTQEMRREREHRAQMRRDYPEFWALLEDALEGVYPRGLCGNRDEHEAHAHRSAALGVFWCTADQTQRLPYAAEKYRKDQ